MSGKDDDLVWANVLRTSATVAVVVLHVAAEPMAELSDASDPRWITANVFDSLSHWCIGVFVMLSGALLLSPNQDETAGTFFAKRARRIAIPLAVWSAVYIALGVALGEPAPLVRVVRMLWVGRPWYHMWYLFMIPGLYALTPLLRRYIAGAGAGLRWFVIVLLFVAASAWHLNLAAANRVFPRHAPILFVPYVGYYLAGYELRHLTQQRVPSWLSWALFTIAALVTILGTQALVAAHGINRRGLTLYGNLSPNVIVMSLALFSLGTQIKGEEPATSVESLRGRFVGVLADAAPLAFGVFLVHPMVLALFASFGVVPSTTGGLLGVPLVVLPTLALSLVATWILVRVPGLCRCVGISEPLRE